MVAALTELDRKLCPSIEDLVTLLRQRIALSNSFRVVIDGLDECDVADQRIVLEELASISSTTPKLKIFLASRESVSMELEERFPLIGRVSMTSAGSRSDISAFIEGTLQERIRDKDLVTQDPSLLEEIRSRVNKHADGM
jgi:hypothetical protein